MTPVTILLLPLSKILKTYSLALSLTCWNSESKIVNVNFQLFSLFTTVMWSWQLTLACSLNVILSNLACQPKVYLFINPRFNFWIWTAWYISWAYPAVWPASLSDSGHQLAPQLKSIPHRILNWWNFSWTLTNQSWTKNYRLTCFFLKISQIITLLLLYSRLKYFAIA